MWPTLPALIGPTGILWLDLLVDVGIGLTSLGVVWRAVRAVWRRVVLPVGRAADAVIDLVPLITQLASDMRSATRLPEIEEYLHDFKHRTVNALTTISLAEQALAKIAEDLAELVHEFRQVVAEIRELHEQRGS